MTLGILFGAGILLIFLICLGFGIGIMSGDIPNTKALKGDEIPRKQIQKLVDLEIIEEGETVKFFYSAAMFNLGNEGNLFTNSRVISYEMENGERHVYEARYEEIEDMAFEDSDDFIQDSLITIIKDDEAEFYLIVSNEEDGDSDFYRELKTTWQRKRIIQKGRP